MFRLATAQWLLDQLTALLDDAISGHLMDARQARERADERAGKLEAELAGERAWRMSLEARVSAQQTTLDFLTRDVNTLNLERAALLTRLTGIAMPTVELVREEPEKRTVVAIEQLVDQIKAEQGDPKENQQNIGEIEAGGLQALFEDMGDEAAKSLGVRVNDVGEVEYVR